MSEKIESKEGNNQEQLLREKVLELIRNNEQRAGAFIKSYRRWDLGLLITSIIVGTLATVIAGGTAVGGTQVMQTLGGWRLICGVVAVFTGIATICGTIHKTLQINTRVTSAIECSAKLQSLEIALTVENKNPTEVAESYRQTLEKHSDCLT